MIQSPVTYGATQNLENGGESDDDSYEIHSSHAYPISVDNVHDESDDDDEIHPAFLTERLLSRTSSFSLAHDVDRGYRGDELNLLTFQRPHMRAFHGSWICYFLSCALQFAVCPLLPEIATSLSLSKSDVWLSNIWSMVGGIPMGFLLGPLCDQYGARILITSLLACCAIPCLFMGFISALQGLVVARTIMGSMDAFVPSQFWITCHFSRKVVGTALAISGGWGSSGAGFVQLVVGSIIFPICVWLTNGNTDLAWRLSLILPALLALYVAAFFYKYSDDCPLGNYKQVKRAGLMMERSAVDSFRSGAMNVNAWILFLQFAGSCGVDLTMCNGTAIYYHERFHQPIAAAGAIAFLYGVSSFYARGLGGYVSDTLGDRYSLRGRLVAQMICMIVQGLLCVCFAHVKELGHSIFMLFIFSILIQMSMGTCFGIVSYVDGPNTGTIAGIVGSGGNVGAVWLGRVFMTHESYSYCMEYMGWFTVVLAFLTPLIVVKGYRGLLFGKEEAHEQHVSLMVPS